MIQIEDSFRKAINKLANMIDYHKISDPEMFKEYIYTRTQDEDTILLFKRNFEMWFYILRERFNIESNPKNLEGKGEQFVSIRKKLYRISNEEKEERFENFFEIVIESLLNEKEIKIPIQLLELIFDFDFHRGAIHPFPSSIRLKFKKKGLRLTKVRNHYIARIRPNS